MDETILCPGCLARLTLPVLPTEQAMQCPRCLNVFELSRQRTVSARASVRPVLNGEKQSQDSSEDLDEADIAPDWRLTRPEPLRGEWKATAAMLSLVVCILSFGVQGYPQFEQIKLTQKHEHNALVGIFRVQIPPGGGADEQRRKRHLEQLQSIALMLLNATFWPAMFFFLLWLQQAFRNLRNLQAEGLSYTRGGPGASFFIPIINFYRPYCVIQELWRATYPLAIDNPLSWMKSPKSLLVRFWWFSYLACWFVVMLSCCVESLPLQNFNHLNFNIEDYIGLPLACLQIICAVNAGIFLALPFLSANCGEAKSEAHYQFFDLGNGIFDNLFGSVQV